MMTITRHENLLDPARAALIIVDVQEAFREIIPDFSGLAARIRILAQGMQLLGLPVLITEQYPNGLGCTAHEIALHVSAGTPVIEKTAFSSCGAQAFLDQLEKLGREQIVVAGIEAHICVNQTVHDLLSLGKKVHLAVDCISSRAEVNRKAALTKMLAGGALVTTVEMSLFELLRDARHEHFKAIQALIK